MDPSNLFKASWTRYAIGFLLLLACVIVGLTRPASAESELQQAYKREFAFLEAEKNALTQRIATAETENKAKLEAAKSDIDSLQGQVLGLSLEAERLEEMLLDTERKAEVAGEGDDVVESLLSQVGMTLSQGDLKLPKADSKNLEAQLKQIEFAFDSGIALVERFSRVRQEQGEFFDDSGASVTGTLIRVGNVATYGVSDGASGALAPAGAKRLKMWPEPDAAATAKALAEGQAPERLKLFLYDSPDKTVEKRADKTLVEVIDSGGIIGWVIVGAGLLALLMVLARVVFLWRAASNTDQLVGRIIPHVEEGDIDKALNICRGAKTASGRVLKATLKNLHRSRDEIEDIITESILHEQPYIDRFGSAIMVIAAVSPLLGLLGTVTGMIATFDIITEFGTGNPKLLSGGISIALVTTELGLVVAIPALLLGNLLSGWAESIKGAMDKAALRITNIASGVRLHSPVSMPPSSLGMRTVSAATALVNDPS